jgi:hypothetical protein
MFTDEIAGTAFSTVGGAVGLLGMLVGCAVGRRLGWLVGDAVGCADG